MPPPLRLVQITDLHIHGKPAGATGGRDTAATLAAVVEAVRAGTPAPDLVLATGDLADDASARAYRRLAGLLAPIEAPIHVIPGNHDDADAMRRHLVGGRITDACALGRGAWRICLLDSTVPGEVWGELGPACLAALDGMLESASEPHALVVLHHQPAPIGSPLDAVGLRNADALHDVLDRHDRVRGLVWGHIHHVHESERNGVLRLGTPSTCVQFDAGAESEARVTDEPPAFRRLALHDDGRIETEIVWVADGWA